MLIIGGIIMLLATLPMYLYFELNLRLAGSVIGVTESYAKIYGYSDSDMAEISAWYGAIDSSGILGTFSFIAVFLIICGIVLMILEKKNILKKSNIVNICCLCIPILVTVAVMIVTYPAIFEYRKVFSYLIY